MQFDALKETLKQSDDDDDVSCDCAWSQPTDQPTALLKDTFSMPQADPSHKLRVIKRENKDNVYMYV